MVDLSSVQLELCLTDTFVGAASSASALTSQMLPHACESGKHELKIC